MRLIETEEFVKAANLNGIGGELIGRLLMQLFKFNKCNSIYLKLHNLNGLSFVDAFLTQYLKVQYDYNFEELKRIPEKGPFIIISNHPFGGLDGLILLKLISERRPDFKFLANFSLQKIDAIKDYFLPVNPFEEQKEKTSSFSRLRNAIKYLENGNGLGIFPAGQVSTVKLGKNTIVDKEWQLPVIKLIKKARAPIIPIYFNGSNSGLFQFLSKIHPSLQTIKLPSELFNKKNQEIRIRIGNPILPKEQDEFNGISQFSRFLRLKTYALGSSLNVKQSFFRKSIIKRKPQEIIPPVSRELILKELEIITPKHLLSESGVYKLYCAPAKLIPNTLMEIARLREMTYRIVGEGTNRSYDMDEYDLFYDQLFIWNNETNKIIGAYRLGKGKEIIAQFGFKGFYISSLFKIKPGAEKYLDKTIELGRSFVIKEYQTKPLSLFMLWKGVLLYMIQNKEYRYLVGPVSISNNFSTFSKELIIEFIRANFYSKDAAPYFEPRKVYKVKLNNKELDKNLVLNIAKQDVNKLDRFIQDIEPDYRMPILLKKYLQQNAKFIAFNVDPKFNNCLDGLMIQDLDNFPYNMLEFILRDVDKKIIYNRFRQWNNV